MKLTLTTITLWIQLGTIAFLQVFLGPPRMQAMYDIVDDWGVTQTYVIINAGTSTYLAGGVNSDGAPTFASTDFGDFHTDGSLILEGGEIKTAKSGNANACGGNLNYRIYETGSTPGAFTAVALTFAADLGDGNQKWDNTVANIDLLAGLSTGEYTIEVYWDAVGGSVADDCSETKYDSNNSANYTASFSFQSIACDGSFDACGVCNGPGEIYECGCSDIPEGDCDCEGNITDAFGVCGGSCTQDNDGNGVCDNEEVYGCSYALAVNYEAAVTRDDGSCVFEPCGFGTVWDEDSQTCILDESNCGWQPDGNADGLVGISDLLDLLGVYGDVDMDGDGIWDSQDLCVDTNACNYHVFPSDPCAFIDVLGNCGGGCEADEDADGICDDVDTCVGIEDECGVCNGPGPTEIVIDEIVITYDSIYLPVDGEWFVYAVNVDTTFSYTCAPFFGDCGDAVSYQGYDYATVLIGDQCWFAENLRSEHYQNGDTIHSGLSNSEWSSTTLGATATYYDTYGRLYNWFAVDDSRGLCPIGWHVPSDGEWMILEIALGMSESEAHHIGWRGTDQGTQMKTTWGWGIDGGINGTNSSGFSGLPGGYRDSENGVYYGNGYDGLWWSSTPSFFRYMWNIHEDVRRGYLNQRNGFSVRCIQDAE